MRIRRVAMLAIVGGLSILAVYLVWPDQNDPFARFICSPVPRTVRVVLFKNNDWFRMDPEPVCYLAFTASPHDMADVIRKSRFQIVTNDSIPVPSGPAGWRPADPHRPARRK